MRPRSALVVLIVALGACLVGGCNEVFPKRKPGEKIFRARCAECHGINGEGNTPRYMGNPRADLTRTDGDLGSMEVVIREGVFGEMPANPDLTAAEMKELLGWIRYLRGEAY